MKNGLILTQNLADAFCIQGLLLKCPNPAPWDSQLFELHSVIILWKQVQNQVLGADKV